jgi:hypothetical protein
MKVNPQPKVNPNLRERSTKTLLKNINEGNYTQSQEKEALKIVDKRPGELNLHPNSMFGWYVMPDKSTKK